MYPPVTIVYMNLSTAQIDTIKALCSAQIVEYVEAHRKLKLERFACKGASDKQAQISENQGRLEAKVRDLEEIVTAMDAPAFDGVIKILDNDSDWQALYVDGKKVIEGHSLSNGNVLKALGYRYEFVEVPEEKGKAAFPDRLPPPSLHHWVPTPDRMG
jgi:hypothetical protein